MTNVLAIDVNLAATKGLTRAGFRDSLSMLGHDVVLWRHAAQAQGLPYSTTSRGAYYLDEKYAHQLEEAINRRADEIRNLFAASGVLVIFANGRPPTYARSSGDMVFASVWKDASLIYGSGSLYDLTREAPRELEDLFQIISPGYSAHFRGISGTPLACVRNTTYPIAYTEKNDAGALLIVLPDTPKVTGSWSTHDTTKFLEILSTIIKKLRGEDQHKELPAPTWLDQYMSSAEEQLILKQDEVTSSIEKLRGELLATEDELRAEQRWKALFHAHDEIFEEVLVDALNTIGIHAVLGVPLRADVIAAHGNNVFAIEAKGKESKGANRANVTQCRTWVLEVERALIDSEPTPDVQAYQDRLRTLGFKVPYPEDATDLPTVKGMLAINGYRLQPLSERSEPVFHPNIAAEIAKTQLCGVTGALIHKLLVEGRKTKTANFATHVANLFQDTDGVIEGPYDQFIHRGTAQHSG